MNTSEIKKFEDESVSFEMALGAAFLGYFPDGKKADLKEGPVEKQGQNISDFAEMSYIGQEPEYTEPDPEPTYSGEEMTIVFNVAIVLPPRCVVFWHAISSVMWNADEGEAEKAAEMVALQWSRDGTAQNDPEMKKRLKKFLFVHLMQVETTASCRDLEKWVQPWIEEGKEDFQVVTEMVLDAFEVQKAHDLSFSELADLLPTPLDLAAYHDATDWLKSVLRDSPWGIRLLNTVERVGTVRLISLTVLEGLKAIDDISLKEKKEILKALNIPIKDWPNNAYFDKVLDKAVFLLRTFK